MNRFTRVAFSWIFALVAGSAILLVAGSLAAQTSPDQATTQKLSASAIQIERAEPSPDLVIPEDFRVATYENVILQVEKTNKFQHVYRSGDRTAASVPDLVIMRLVPQAYKAGSQKEREVTTVAGSTSMKINLIFSDKSGKVLMEKEIEGKVRFFGENLRATYDLAKKVAAVVNESF
jgi:hypothetical protein